MATRPLDASKIHRKRRSENGVAGVSNRLHQDVGKEEHSPNSRCSPLSTVRFLRTTYSSANVCPAGSGSRPLIALDDSRLPMITPRVVGALAGFGLTSRCGSCSALSNLVLDFVATPSGRSLLQRSGPHRVDFGSSKDMDFTNGRSGWGGCFQSQRPRYIKV